jgi:phospholipase/carboxylesterase
LNEFEAVTLNNWPLRVRQPAGPGPHPTALLLHGLTGDENVMGIFATRLPQEYLVVSPRGLFPSTGGGFSWLEKNFGAWPHLEDFQGPISKLHSLLDHCQVEFGDDFSSVHILGFSQGTALAYGFALTSPMRVNTVSGLAGFLPTGVADLAAEEPLAGKKAFVTHGTKDDLVPVDRARHAVKILKMAGAEVVYCEADVGHKLDAGCFRALGHFHKSL